MPPSTAQAQDWWKGAVFYQIYPRSFLDSNGDGIGDLNGIESRLDYIAALGVDAVWISPFFKSPMLDFGYDVADYCAVDPIFGTMADFDRLLEGLHRRGLRLVIDMVLSHTSNQHPWFLESRRNHDNAKADWYVWADPKPDGSAPNNWLSVFGGPAWQFEPRRNQYYLHNFLPEQPDLNITNPAVQDALLAEAEFWLKRGVDGFRLDAVNFCMHDPLLRDNPPKENSLELLKNAGGKPNPCAPTYAMQRHLYDISQDANLSFMRRMRGLADRYPGRMLVAEIGDERQIELSAQYTASPDLLHTAYTFALLGDQSAPAYIRSVVEKFFSCPGTGWPSWSLSNHDVMRVASRWAKNGRYSAAQAKMLIALVASLQGTAFLYQGEELGLTEADVPFEKFQDPFGKNIYPEGKGRDGCRTPMPWDGSKPHAGFTAGTPWLPVAPEHGQKSVAAQESDAGSILAFTRAFLKWRKTNPALVTGRIAFLDLPESVLGFTRGEGAETVVACFNMEDASVTITLPFPAQALLEAGFAPPAKNAGETQTITLPAFGVFLGLRAE